jgi:hypothetical protein
MALSRSHFLVATLLLANASPALAARQTKGKAKQAVAGKTAPAGPTRGRQIRSALGLTRNATGRPRPAKYVTGDRNSTTLSRLARLSVEQNETIIAIHRNTTDIRGSGLNAAKLRAMDGMLDRLRKEELPLVDRLHQYLSATGLRKGKVVPPTFDAALFTARAPWKPGTKKRFKAFNLNGATISLKYRLHLEQGAAVFEPVLDVKIAPGHELWLRGHGNDSTEHVFKSQDLAFLPSNLTRSPVFEVWKDGKRVDRIELELPRVDLQKVSLDHLRGRSLIAD